MRGKVLMVQGTMSSVGKSLTVAALCRIFAADGIRVAPFKGQNMALNSYVTRDGLEVGRAQAMQAEAAGIEVTVEMNPVLIKPEADAFAQYVVMGKPWARLAAYEYMAERRGELWQIVTRALDTLRDAYDLVVIEGAGSPAELNLRAGDLVNMAIAEYADAPVILVGDIDRGGIFAQLLGTHQLLEGSERARIRGFIVNKFRGDARLFEDGVRILETRSGVPVLGVVPFVHNVQIADEDSVVLDERRVSNPQGVLEVAVVALPHMSNFDDFDPLRVEPDVRVTFVREGAELGAPDLIVLPGTKTTIADLEWMRRQGLAARVVALARAGTPVLGICGGYQMLGDVICDPDHIESGTSEVAGLGLLRLRTMFEGTKQTVRAEGTIRAESGLFANAGGIHVKGYEIHMGRALPASPAMPLVEITRRRDEPISEWDGVVSADGWIAGTYLHGLFDNDALRASVLQTLAERRGVSRSPTQTRFDRNQAYDRLAAVVRAHLDMQAVYRLAGLGA